MCWHESDSVQFSAMGRVSYLCSIEAILHGVRLVFVFALVCRLGARNPQGAHTEARTTTPCLWTRGPRTPPPRAPAPSRALRLPTFRRPQVVPPICADIGTVPELRLFCADGPRAPWRPHPCSPLYSSVPLPGPQRAFFI